MAADPPPPPPPSPSIEDLFADWLDRVAAGEALDFAAFCAAHPAAAPSLRLVHERWQVMTQAFARLSEPGPAVAADVSAPALDQLKRRLGPPGTRLARYALGQEIARGAMGRIVRAWDEELGREVALKLQREGAGDARQQRRFLEEAQIAAQLDHPGIVPIHELGLDADGRPFFAMQLVRGHDLGRILADARAGRDGWNRTRVLLVLLRVCEAMAFAHERGVVHRDLKPANIMVGRFGEAYVMDWGLAHVHGRAAAASDSVATLRQQLQPETADSALLTGAADVVGTPAYMAPEQATGGAAATAPAVDVYALGAILWHLLAGTAPYDGDQRSAHDVLTALRNGPPTELPHDAPPELRAICERAMARRAEDRYPGMVALADDLRAFVELRTVQAYATGRFAELRKWVARNRTLTALAGALVLALAGGAAAVTTFWLRAESDRARADASATRLVSELDRSAFRAARQSLQLDNSADAADTLWRTHLLGRMPRATSWALRELAGRDPYLTTVALDQPGAAVAFGGLVAVALVGGADGRLQLRSLDTLAVLAELGTPGARVTSITAPSGTTLAVAGNTDGEVIVFDLAARREVSRSRPHRGSVRNLVATSAESFASGGADGRVLWWAHAGAPVKELFTLGGEITALAPYPGAPGVVAGNADGVVKGVAVDRSWRFDYTLDPNQVTALAFGQRGPELWVGSTNHQLRYFDLKDAKNHRIWPTRNGTCRQLARDHDGSLVLGGWWRIDRVSAGGAALGPVALRGISRMALDADRRLLLTSDQINGLGLVDVAARDRRVLPGGQLALSGDGRRYAVCEDDRIVVRDVDSGAVVARSPAGYGAARLRLDRTGERVALATRQPLRVEVLDLATGTSTVNCEGQADDPRGDGCSFARAGDEVAVIVGTHRIRRLRTADGEVLAEYSVPGARFTRTTYSADGRWLAAIRRGEPVVRVFDLANGTARDEIFTADLPAGSALSAIAVSHHGDQIVVGTWNGGMLVRRRDGTTTTLSGHNGTVTTLQFLDADAQLLVSAGGTQGVAFWDLEADECCAQLLQDVVGQLQVDADGHTLACSLPDGSNLLLDLTYHDRHVAGNLAYQLARLRSRLAIDATRATELLQWAEHVQGRPWPRWR